MSQHISRSTLSLFTVVAACSSQFAAAPPAMAQVQEKAVAEKACSELFPSFWSDYFARSECIREAMDQINAKRKAERDEKDKKEREGKARECIAGDLSRMELALKKVGEEIRKEYEAALIAQAGKGLSITDLIRKIKEIDSNLSTDIVAATDNIREKVIVSTIKTKCNSDFHFLINIRSDQNDQLLLYRYFAQNSPTGYQPQASDLIIKEIDFMALRNNFLKEEEDRKKAQEELNKIAAPGSPGFLADPSNGCKVWDPVPTLPETVSWDGACVDGLAHGTGTVFWRTYKTMNNLSTEEILNLPVTSWNKGNYLRGRETDGPFEDKYSDGTREIGTRVNGQRFGSYKRYSSDGNILQDLNYVNGKKNNQGTIVYADKRKYVGNFKDDKYDGQGTLLTSDDVTIYEGGFDADFAEGFGFAYFPSKSIADAWKYGGNFKSGFADGNGTAFIYKDGQSVLLKLKAKNGCLWNVNDKTFSTFIGFIGSKDAEKGKAVWSKDKCLALGFPY